MKFDIVRAWKDENYRQSLSEEQADMLPANPAGELELSSAELRSVSGDGGFAGPGPIGGSAAGASSTSLASGHQFWSLAVDCSSTVFSLTFNSGAFLSPVTTFCIDARRRAI